MQKKTIIILSIIILLLIFFFPKNAGYSYGGFIRFGEINILHREESSCIGLKYLTSGGIFAATDSGKTIYCSGIPINKRCYEWQGEKVTQDFSSEKEIVCKN